CNASVIGPGANPIIVDNSTHLITEWKGIFGYFNPQEPFINALWREILPAFDYLLNMTPRLTIEVEKAVGGIKLGDNAAISFKIRNLSPHLSSVDPIYIAGDDGNIIAKGRVILEAYNSSEVIAYYLPEDMSADGFTIGIGNNYTGYARFIISSSLSSRDSSSTAAFEYWIILVVLPLLFYMKGSRYKANKSFNK
ncbi:MAG: hypothetical protein ACFFB3_16090, partial [Candidatus Hodarchaeota archaeon]